MVNPSRQHLDSFTVTGFKTKTQNSDEFNADTASLPKLWQQFYDSTLTKTVPSYGVYSDYDSNEQGHYQVTVGIVDDIEESALSKVKINSGNYLVFKGQGPMPQTVIETWQSIWGYFSKECPFKRCFKTDFEMYHGDEVAIYIGVH